MRRTLPTLLAIGLLSAGAAVAQTGGTTGTGGSAGGSGTMAPGAAGGSTMGGSGATDRNDTNSNRAVNTPETTQSTTANQPLVPGANSFTEGEARRRMESHGFQNVMDLKKDEQGIWRGRAQQNGKPVNVGLDFKGTVSTQ